MNQSVPGHEASVWVGVGAPKGTPPESSNGSTATSMWGSPMQRSRCGTQNWLLRRSSPRRRNSEKVRSGLQSWVLD